MTSAVVLQDTYRVWEAVVLKLGRTNFQRDLGQHRKKFLFVFQFVVLFSQKENKNKNATSHLYSVNKVNKVGL